MSTLSLWLSWLLACACGASALGALATGSRGRRRLAVALGTLALGVPWLVPREATVLRSAVALEVFWSWLKVIGLAQERKQRGLAFRVVQMLVVHDLRRDAWVRGGTRPSLLAQVGVSALLTGAVALAALYGALFVAPGLASPWAALARYGFGVVFAYFGIEGVLRGFELVYRCAGLEPPVFHRHPILARSIAEFWAQRWNRVVGAWLFDNIYRPLARRGPTLASAATFAASALLHVYFITPALGLRWGLVMGAFFIIQIPLSWLEARLDERRWSTPLQRIWTIGWLTLISPLFLEPLLRVLAGGFAR